MSEAGELTNREQMRRMVANTHPSEYRGHTGFLRLSASEKLDALASMCVFVHEFKGKAGKQKGCRLQVAD